jgi:hypothetical protein
MAFRSAAAAANVNPIVAPTFRVAREMAQMGDAVIAELERTGG